MQKQVGRADYMNILKIKNSYNFIVQIFSISVLSGIPLIFSCGYEADSDDKHDLFELERVWQYMKAFSIYTDRVPDEERALSFSDPASLVDSIYDTMHYWVDGRKGVYGRYYSDWIVLYKELFDTGRFRNNQFAIETKQSSTIYYKQLSDSITYINIKEFGRYTAQEFRDIDTAIADVPNLIIDLRWNGGGFIAVCTSIVHILLPDNTSYLKVTYRKDLFDSKVNDTGTVKDEIWKTSISNTRTTAHWKGKSIALLINPMTASASEMMSLALRYGMASTRIFGERSFGKGIGQYPFFFNETSGGALKLTYLHFYAVNGEDCHEKGIEPDKEVISSGYPYYYDKEGLQLLEAANSFESDFDINKDSTAFYEVVDQYNSYVESIFSNFRYRCFNDPIFEELPDF